MENGDSDWSAFTSLQRLAYDKEGGAKCLLGVEKTGIRLFLTKTLSKNLLYFIVKPGLEKSYGRCWNPREAILFKDTNKCFFFFKQKNPHRYLPGEGGKLNLTVFG